MSTLSRPLRCTNAVGIRSSIERPPVARTVSPKSKGTRRGLLAGLVLAPVIPRMSAPAKADDFEFTVLTPSQRDGLKARDEAMKFQCSGGMMDCDGDRRDYAQKQIENFADKREGRKPLNSEGEECRLEEVCGDDFFGSVVMGLNGMSPPEKFKSAGVNQDRPNSISFYE